MASGALEQASEPTWLATHRSRAAQLSQSLELPTPKTEGWEFTAIQNLDLAAYAPATDGDEAAFERALTLFGSENGSPRVDQVDARPLATQVEAPEGAPLVMPLALAAERFPDLVGAHFAGLVTDQDPFVAANDTAWSGGAFVYVPQGQRLAAPAVLTCVQDAAGRQVNWRTLIVLEAGAEAEVWEQWVSTADDTDGFFNAVTEVSVGEGANLRYVCAQGLSQRSWVFGTQRAQVARDGSLDWIALGFGSGRGKVRMQTNLAGQGAEARVTGGYAGNHRQHLDYDTTQEHAAPNTTSDLAFRGLLDGRATAVWRGMIHVAEGAQKTDAFQESRNLLLSKRAHADAIPGLEIEADDVRCTHAATVAQIDKEQLFYLRSHGVAKTEATRLVIEGFMQALVERLAAGTVRDTVAGALERRLATILD